MTPKERYRYRKEHRLCTQCGRPLEEGETRTRCRKCKEKTSSFAKERRAYLKKQGRCTRCGKKVYLIGATLCEECNAMFAEHSHRWRVENPEKYALTQQRSKQKRRDRRKEQGLCISCGKRPPAEGHDKCRFCMSASARYAREERRQKGFLTEQDKREMGLCRICYTPAVPGKRYCAEHLRIRQAVMERARKVNEECGNVPSAEGRY